MKKTGILLLFAVLVSGLGLVFSSESFAETEREEVAQRIELNSATVEELVNTGAVDKELAEKIIELRDQLGSFQSYEDLEELEIPQDQLEKLHWNTTIQGIASDCTC